MKKDSALQERDRRKKPIVVFVLSGYGCYARGAEEMVRALVSRLASSYEFRVAGRGGREPGAIKLRCLDRENYWTRALNRIPGVGHMLRSLQLDPLNWEWLTCMWSAYAWLRNNPCDLLIPEGGRWGGWLGHVWRKRTGTPFIDIAHGAPGRWERAAARWLPDCYVSSTLVAANIAQASQPTLCVRVIPPGVDPHIFSPEGPRVEMNLERPVVLAVGALEPLKRMDVILAAVAGMEHGSLLLVGDGPEREHLRAMGDRLLGAGRFLWRTGTRDEMPSFYRSADVFVSASRSEAFGLVYLEAMACGLPVVTHDDPVRREVVGDAGWFCDAGDSAVLRKSVLLAVQAGGKKSRARAEAFSMDRMAEQYDALFRSLIRVHKK